MLNDNEKIDPKKSFLGYELVKTISIIDDRKTFFYCNVASGFMRFQPFYKTLSRCLSRLKINE